MAIVPINIPDSTAETQTLETPSLDGTVYRLALRWNEHLESYVMDVETVDGTVLLAGRPLTIDYDLLEGYRLTSLLIPAGQLIALDTGLKGEDCGKGDLGGRVRLIYVEAA